jgi:hypothetical protein
MAGQAALDYQKKYVETGRAQPMSYVSIHEMHLYYSEKDWSISVGYTLSDTSFKGCPELRIF